MKVLIAGGGIAGLTLAHALNQQGIPCQVLEQAAELSEVGAGIWLQPNAMKVLDHLGLGAPLRAGGAALQRAEITDGQLRPFRRVDPRMLQDGAGNGILSIHRGRLQQLLVEALPAGQVRLGTAYEGHRLTTGGGLVVQAGGLEMQADLLLAADGIHSRVRQVLQPGAGLRSSGQICWRGIARYALPDALRNLGREAWSGGLRFGFANVSEDEVYWFAVRKGAAGQYLQRPSREELARHWGDFHPVVGELIRNTPEEAILQHELHELRRLPVWHAGPVCLLGDAAHAMTPNMGQGAGQGIEDAYYLARALAAEPGPAAFAGFEAQRRPKVDGIVRNSWRFGQMAHHPVGRWFMRNMMRWLPERMLSQQMHELYSVEGL